MKFDIYFLLKKQFIFKETAGVGNKNGNNFYLRNKFYKCVFKIEK
jgi:hypothetical protein